MELKNNLVERIFGNLSDKERRKIIRNAGVQFDQFLKWYSGEVYPRIDTLQRVALCAGFEIIVQPVERKELDAMAYKIQTRNDRLEVYLKNVMIAYIENEVLFAIDRKNYANKVSAINHSREIIGKLSEWRKKHGYE